MFYRYLQQVLRHKWFVMVECFGAGLWWRGVVHDWTKFLPSEFLAYAWFFYGPKPVSDKVDLEFDFAWLLHQKHHQHHWQWWVRLGDDGTTRVFEMSPRARLEMLCDWRGAGRAYGVGSRDVAPWYKRNKEKMKLGPLTRDWVEAQLGLKKD